MGLVGLKADKVVAVAEAFAIEVDQLPRLAATVAVRLGHGAIAGYIGIFIARNELGTLRRRPHQGGANHGLLYRADVGRADPIGRIGLAAEVAFVFVVIGAQLQAERIAYRPAERAHGVVIEAAIAAAVHGHARRAGQLVAGFFGVHQYGAAGDVAAEQDALRAAQHFNALQVENVENNAVVNAQIHPVHKHTDRGIDRGD